MKLPHNPRILRAVMVCVTLLLLVFLLRNPLCGVHYKDGFREVVALMAYESGK